MMNKLIIEKRSIFNPSFFRPLKYKITGLAKINEPVIVADKTNRSSNNKGAKKLVAFPKIFPALNNSHATAPV